MKRNSTLVILILFSLLSYGQNSTIDLEYKTYLNTIKEEDLSKHLYIYASDSMEGRGTGQPGQDKARKYLKDQYQELNIRPAQDSGYYQEFTMYISDFLHYNLQYGNKKFAAVKDFYTFFSFDGENIAGENIYYGCYGIDSEQYSNYQGWSAQDKVVLINFDEPKDKQGNYLLSGGTDRSEYSKDLNALYLQIKAAEKNGAKALLIYTDFSQEEMLWGKKSYDDMHKIFKILRYDSQNYKSVRFQNTLDVNLPVFFVSKGFLDNLDKPMNQLKCGEAIPFSYQIMIENNREKLNTANVLAYIPGTEKKDEVIVLSAHLDHLGKKDSIIYNGADDDGSGTVALLEIAEAFQKAYREGKGPKRSILFLHATAEEKGLIGSAYYTKHPIFPMDKTFANLNIDMIGRVDPEHIGSELEKYIYPIGSNFKTRKLDQLLKEVNEELGYLKLDYRYNSKDRSPGYYYRSDQYNFAEKGVPVVFFFSGVHPDYHQPEDDPERIRYDLLEKRTQLIFALAWRLSNMEEDL